MARVDAAIVVLARVVLDRVLAAEIKGREERG
jgi:hypothetical protein